MDIRQEKIEKIGKMIIEGARSDLYVSMRYLDLAIFALNPEADENVEVMGTDGDKIYYSSPRLIEEYGKNARQLNRTYLHSVFHCLFRHLFNSVKYTEEDQTYWDIACDIAVEYIIDDLNISVINPIVSRYRTYIYKRLSAELDMDILTAEAIYKTLKTWDFSDSDFKIMYKAFKTDDHGFWPRPKGGQNPPPSQGNDNSGEGDNPEPPDGLGAAKKLDGKWKDLSERTASQAEHLNNRAGTEDKSLIAHLKAVNRRRYDYREFLRKFAVYGEEVKPDPDSFDPGFYAYGLSLYGNMPIIEPLEFREVKRVSDFVIVIDTSASCEGEAVKAFLSRTFSLLSLRNSFFNRVKIHVIQCDNKVRRDTVIENSEQLERLFNDVELVGFGGTDFRPAFEYVEEIKPSLKNLKGLIYFTDGEGIYPEKPPSYDTAFVFLKEHYYDAEVPSWAVKLILDKEELEKK
ncbi:MAG: VWA-like domain-containing protein [Clostridiales bacterium]|nr:VWA-like domain-containing protein [Clostridiales bacterium]